MQHGPRDARGKSAGEFTAHVVVEQAADLKAKQFRRVRPAAAAHLGVSATD